MQELDILILDGDEHKAINVAVSLAQVPGLAVHALTSDPWAPLRFSRHVRSIHRSEAVGSARVAAALAAAGRCGARVGMPVGTGGMRFAIEHQTKLSRHLALPPLPSLAALELTEDKWQFARFMERHGIATPRTALLAGGAAPPFPALVKPTHGCGGAGIRRVDDATDLRAILAATPDGLPRIVQEYVVGQEIDCSVLCEKGEILAFTIQTTLTGNPDPFAPPLAISFIHHEPTLDLVKRLMKALDWSGVAHVDLIRDARDGCVKVLEVNPRFWGSLLGSVAAGVNFAHLTCLAATGHRFALPDYREVPWRNRRLRLSDPMPHLLLWARAAQARVGRYRAKFAAVSRICRTSGSLAFQISPKRL